MRKLLLVCVFLFPVSVLATPPTPTGTPVAHPLAPNPHTSVGLFWIYTDANTGRQWTGGTYKVKRCSGAACTPTTIVASGLTTADYQDTGLSTNTVYGYRYLANDGADSGDSPTVYVTTLAADSDMVQFPDTVWSNLLGPLPEAAQIPFAYYNNTATTNGQTIISKYPVVGPAQLKGTGAITNNTTTITGTGTFFLEGAAANNPSCLNHIMINGVDAGTISSISSNTSLTLTTTWNGGTVSGATLSTNVPVTCNGNFFGDPINDYVVGNQLGYYDSEKSLWELYFRTGDPQYLRGAVKGSEAVFAGYMWLGRNRAWNGYSTTANTDNMPAPRLFQFQGYVLLGLAGHSGVWDLLDNYLDARYSTWISNYRGGNNDFTFIREKGYTIKFTSWFVMAAPDSFPRSDGSTTSLNGGTTVDGSVATGRKGFYKDQLNTDVPGFILDDQTAVGEWYESNAGDNYAEMDFPYPPGDEQPWITGLVGDALGYCWRNTSLNSTARDAARKEVLRLAAMMGTRGYDTNVAPDETSFRRRIGWYFLGGGTRLNPFAFENGADSSILNNTPDSNMIAQYRQSLPLYLGTFGWAYEMSGQSWYKTQGEEIANAAFAAVGENTGGTGDGKKSLCDNTGNYKDYGQCFATGSGHFFGQRLLSPASLGTPPTVTMPANQTLTGGVNQALLTATVSCANSPCTYKWYLVEYPLMLGRQAIWPTFTADTSLTTKINGMENGVYKLGFYAIDSLGLVGTGTINVTVGDGVFPPALTIHKGGIWWACTTGTSISGIEVRAYSGAGRSLSHAFTISKPKDASAPTVTPSGTTGNFITVSITGLTSTSSSWYLLKDSVSDGTNTRVGYFAVSVHSTCGSFAQPSSGHNTIPAVIMHPNHVLPAGSTSTRLFAAPQDPEGSVRFTSTATGYVNGINGAPVVTALTHSWSQIAGPVTATITNGNTLRPDITGLTQAGTYTFRYTGTDQQSDIVTADINVTVQSGVRHCQWNTNPICQ